MELALFNMIGIHFVLKWLHIFFGILWIGHLYYFNFTQGAFMSQTDAPAKSQVQQKLLPIALWWFRWGAMWTFVTGLAMLHTASYAGFSIHGDWGIKILTGALFGITMWFNVWFIIWPAQKIVIQNAKDVAEGKAAHPGAVAAGARALLASRTNTLFSIPMLFYMVAAAHLPIVIDTSNTMAYWVALLIVWGVLQLNAFKGKLGPMTSVNGVISCGFGLTAVVYLMMEILL
ncbi:MAG: urate hydroxylase PuuD [Bdellovibrionaceae bacterium]|nr:urate hydroxylase PuuD [Pseudobdellovibrionaceae bacterium]